MGAGDHYIGNGVSVASSDFDIEYIHIYKTWRDTDPNA
jgi:hypothetical protein